MAHLVQQAIDTLRQPFPRGCDPLLQVDEIGNSQLGGGRRGRGAQVGHEIGDGEIGFVTDAADHGAPAGGNRPRHTLVVEGPKLLERSTTPHQQD